MELPILEPAPVLTAHTGGFRDLFANQCQCRQVQHDLTGLLVLPTKRMAQMARGLLDSADKPNLSRVLSEAPWRDDAIKHRRICFMLQRTQPHRRRRRESLLAIDATLWEHVGGLFDDVDRHDNHRAGTSPLAHQPVTSFYISGLVRVPRDRRRYRRAEALTQWDAAVAKPFPHVHIPTDKKARHRLHQQVAPVLLADPEGRARHEPCRTTIMLALELVAEAIRHNVPFGVVGFDACSLAEDVVQVLARRRKDWSSLLTTHRLLETASVHRRDAHGWPLTLPGPHLAVDELVPRSPATAYRPVTVGEPTSWSFTLAVRIPGLGKVRIVVSCEQESVTGRQVVLVTNRLDWSAAKIISLQSCRWPTATWDQDSTGHLGFPEDRMRSAEALGHHWGLVFVASSLRHLTCLPAGPSRTWGLIHTMGDACRHQGRALLQKLVVFVHDQLSQGAPMEQVFAQVFARQRGSVLV